MEIIFKYKYLFLLFIFIFLNELTNAQFYNGHQMKFGKNRVQYHNRYWRYHRYEKYDTYYYKQGDSLSRKVAKYADEIIPDIENFFGYGLKKRVIFLCYQKLSDFRESNVGYSSNKSSNVGGSTRIIDNKVFIYFDGSDKNIKKQITEGISQLLINEMLYGGSYVRKFTSSATIELPNWYISGLISYLSEEWSFKIENIVKDGFQSKKYKKINHLIGDNAKYAGHSFWYFIGEEYGKDVIPNIVYLTRVNKNSDAGFKYVLGLSVKHLSPIWKDFYLNKFGNFSENINLPNTKQEIYTGKRNAIYQRIKVSNDNKYIAFVENNSGRYKIKILNKKTGKIKTIRKKGHKLEQIIDYSYPVIAWHPSSKQLIFFTEEQGRLRLYFYNIEEKKLQKRNIMFFDKVLSANYSDDGFKLAISATKDGKTDIYIYNVSAGNFDRITNDNFEDTNPTFVSNSKKILFSSNRASKNSLKDLFIYSIDNKSFTQLSNTPYYNETNAIEINKNIYSSLTDKTGIIQRQVVKYDSTVSYIDTTIHYRYHTNDFLVSNYSRNIESYDYNKTDNKISEIIFNNKRFHIYDIEHNNITQKNNISFYRNKFTEKAKYKDSIRSLKIAEEKLQKLKIDSLKDNPPSNLLHPDSIPVDVNNYVFETERKIQYYQLNPIKPDTFNIKNNDSTELLPTFNYLTNFYTNYVVQQVDFGSLSYSYQAYTGKAFYFDPGLNLFTQIGIYDLFENYRITGAYKLGVNLDSYEILFGLEDIKNQIDKQYVYHRQTYSQTDNIGNYFYIWKMFSNEFLYKLKYPFNQVASIKATLSLKHDKRVFLSTDMTTLAEPDQHQIFSGIQLDYVFDNVKNIGLNLYNGTRFKIFTQFYQEVDQEYTNLFVTGFDFRYYKKIHRNLIFASRTAASASFGKSKLLYYLGGVDNWYVFSSKKMKFDNSVNINKEQNYVYQAVATNMRGFVQNARNGTNFAVINNEIRFPIIRYLVNRPLNSSFLNNFQIVGFADAGAAWSGLTPYSDANKYNTETIKRGSITVVIDKERWPVIFGYGFGVRSKVLGYFVRLDWAWGIDNYVIYPRIAYFSLNLDF